MQRQIGVLDTGDIAVDGTPEVPPSPDDSVDGTPGLCERIGSLGEARDSREGCGPAPELDVTGRRRQAPAQLRWSLKCRSAAGPSGDLWGDTHFADALAKALRDLG
jgi:hypothetical protein